MTVSWNLTDIIYYTRYGIRLDDELILMLIRISELHGDMKKELRTQPRIQFRHARDYFWFGLKYP